MINKIDSVINRPYLAPADFEVRHASSPDYTPENVIICRFNGNKPINQIIAQATLLTIFYRRHIALLSHYYTISSYNYYSTLKLSCTPIRHGFPKQALNIRLISGIAMKSRSL